jgi:hypothetical protein
MGMARIACGATCECTPAELVIDASHKEHTSIQATASVQATPAWARRAAAARAAVPPFHGDCVAGQADAARFAPIPAEMQVGQHDACELEVVLLPESASGEHKFKVLGLSVWPNPIAVGSGGSIGELRANLGVLNWAWLEEKKVEEY